MKKANLLRLFCVILGIITILLAIPAFAEDSMSAKAADAPFNVDIDFEIGKELEVIKGTDGGANATNVSESLKADIRTPNDYNTTFGCGIYLNPTDNSDHALKIVSSASYFAVKDTDNKLAGGDFNVSADFYLTLENFTDNKSVRLIQWIRSADLGGNDGTMSNKYEFIRVTKDGSLCLGATDLGCDVSDKTWFNITANVKHVSGDTYGVSLYLNGKLIKTFEQEMAAPTDGGSYIVFYTRNNCTCRDCYLDNVRIYQPTAKPIVSAPKNARFNTLIDFDTDKGEITTGINGERDSTIGAENINYSAGNISGYYNTDDVKVLTGLDVASGNMIFNIKKDPTNSNNYTLRIENRCFFAVKDVNKKLPDGDFVVSADMYLPGANAPVADNYQLLRWTRGETLNSTAGSPTYTLAALNKNKKLVANGKELDITLPSDKWFNITAKVKYLSGDRYRISLYLDIKTNPDPILVYDQYMPEPDTGNEGSYIVVFDRAANFLQARLDNLHIYESTDILDTTITFNDCPKTVSGNVYGTGETNNVAPFVNTDKTAVTFALDHGISLPAKIWPSPTDSNNMALRINGSNGFVAIEDLEGRLEKSDFTVSGKMYLNFDNYTSGSSLTLLQWSKGPSLKKDDADTKHYSLVSVDKDGNLIANSVILDHSVTHKKWFAIAAKIKHLSKDSYNVSLYLDGELIYTYNQEMPAPEVGSDKVNKFYIRFLNMDMAKISESYLDDLHVSEALPYELELDFNSDYTSTLDKIGADNYFPAIGGGKATVADGYLRIDHNGLTADQSGYIVADHDKFIDCDQYLIEADFRYSGNAKFNATVATLVSDNYSKIFTPVGINGNTNKLYTTIGGLDYDLYTKDGSAITANATSEADFTKVAILVNEGNLEFTVYVNDRLAYYYSGKTLTPCVTLPIAFENSGIELLSSECYASQLRLLEIDASKDNDCTLDISRIAVKALPSGISSEIKGTQTKQVVDTETYGVRFVSAIDSLYGSSIGFEITAVYTDENGIEQTKEYDESSTLVYERIEADGKYVYPYELDCEYFSVIQITDIPNDISVTFTAKPYVKHGGKKIYGEATTQTFGIDSSMLSLDFNTELSLDEYIASSDGVELHEIYKGGEIIDGL